MKITKALICLLPIILSGCFPTSRHPLYTDKDVVFDENLVGKWSKDNVVWEFKRGDGDSYAIRRYDNFERRFIGHLVELEDELFLDLFPLMEEEKDNGFYWWHLQPTHSFMKIDQIEPVLQMKSMDSSKVKSILNEFPDPIQHEILDDRVLFTAPTEKLQEFVLNFQETDELFGDPEDFIRHEPLYTEQDLVFDECLIGIWEGEDSLLKIEWTDDELYQLSYYGEDMTSQAFATLIEYEGITLFGLFFDKTLVENLNPNEFPMLPDALMLVEQQDANLKLEVVTYDEFSRIVQEEVSVLYEKLDDPEMTLQRIK